MSVLTKIELQELAANRKLLGSDYEANNFQPCSYDLRIGTVFKNQQIFRKNLEDFGFTNTVIVKPSEIVTFLTLEIISIPKHCSGTVYAINKQSSRGLLILNPGHIDPGYIGPISVCAINLSKEEIVINIGDSIFTLIVTKLTKEISDEDAYKSKFKDRKTKEEDFNKRTALKLSGSFFDLISTFKSSEYFKAQVVEVIKSQANKMYLLTGGFIVVFLWLCKIGFLGLNNPFDWKEETTRIKQKYDSLYDVSSKEIEQLKRVKQYKSSLDVNSKVGGK